MGFFEIFRYALKIKSPANAVFAGLLSVLVIFDY
jgi:hypothetical protein